MRKILQLIGLLLIVFAGISFSIQPDKQPPNLLIIQTDEHNFRTLGCYRETLPPEQALVWGKAAVVETPNIDWIAENGALCTKFYATSPVCSPSRASFVSGKYPQNTAVVKNNIPMQDDIITFAEILRATGYKTGYAGKWHLDGTGKPQWAPERKFGFTDNRYMFNRGHWKKLADSADGPKIDTGEKRSYSVADATAKNYTTDWLADKTIEFINENSSKPFCYMVSFPDPHGPDKVRIPYDTMYNEMIFDKPPTYHKATNHLPSWAKPQKNNRNNQSNYFGMVKCIDDNVGRILNTLREKDLLENTIVVFTSDHGDMRDEHHRNNKGIPLEASAKIPFLIYYKDRIKAGTIVKQALGTVDFLPTILGLMDVKTAAAEDGRDASALFINHDIPIDWKDITFVRGAGAKQKWIGAFTGRYKLIVSPDDSPWLIDMRKDPDELNNYCSDPAYREISQTLAKELLTYGKKFNDPKVFAIKIHQDLSRLAKEN